MVVLRTSVGFETRALHHATVVLYDESTAGFTTIAEGMGIRTEQAETPEEIMKATKSALSTGPTLIEIPTDPYKPQASEFMTH